jgi:hypothetical protein
MLYVSLRLVLTTGESVHMPMFWSFLSRKCKGKGSWCSKPATPPAFPSCARLLDATTVAAYTFSSSSKLQSSKLDLNEK